MVDWMNSSYDLLVNGSVIGAAVESYEQATTIIGIIWIWPILFLMTLFIVAIKSENPTVVAIVAILGNVALGARLDIATHRIFYLIIIFSIVIWLFSLFISRKTEN